MTTTTNKKLAKHVRASINAANAAAGKVAEQTNSMLSPMAKGINNIQDQNKEIESAVGDLANGVAAFLDSLEDEREDTDKKIKEEHANTQGVVKKQAAKTRAFVKEDGDKTRTDLGEKIDEANTKINHLSGQLSNLTALVDSLTKGNKNSACIIKKLVGERDQRDLLIAFILSDLDKHENENVDSDKTVEAIKVLLKDVIIPSDCDTGAALKGFRARLNDGGNAEAVQEMADKVKKEEEAVTASEKLADKAAKTAANARNTFNTLKNLAKKK